MAQEALGFMQNSKEKNLDFIEILSKEPDNILSLDVSSVKTLQIGYQAETLLLHKADANRFKTTIRYGRRETVNPATCIEIFLPDSFNGELLLSSQYGNIITDADWNVERFAAETTEGSISLSTITAPRIRLVSSISLIHITRAEGFTDIHSVSGTIIADCIEGGAKLATSSSPIQATFSSLNNIVECETLNGNIQLTLPENCGMKIDGISKRGSIHSNIEGLSIKEKPGNVQNITGILGEKPFYNVRISTINGNISLT